MARWLYTSCVNKHGWPVLNWKVLTSQTRSTVDGSKLLATNVALENIHPCSGVLIGCWPSTLMGAIYYEVINRKQSRYRREKLLDLRLITILSHSRASAADILCWWPVEPENEMHWTNSAVSWTVAVPEDVQYSTGRGKQQLFFLKAFSMYNKWVPVKFWEVVLDSGLCQLAPLWVLTCLWTVTISDIGTYYHTLFNALVDISAFFFS